MNLKNYKPSEAELEILQVLWEKESCTVREVHEILEQNKETGYTTTLKQMQVMLEKGLVSRDTSSKIHIYKAEAPREEVQQEILDKLIDTVYKGSTARLVMQALGNHSA